MDLASPSAIGSTTPNTGAFTTLSANNGTITTSSPAFTLAQTWNASGTTFTALRVNATDTASASASLLMDLQVGGTSRAKFEKTGRLTLTYDSTATRAGSIGMVNTNRFEVGTTGNYAVLFTADAGNQYINFVSTSGGIGIGTAVSNDCILIRDAANVMAVRNGTNAQTFRLYRTYTDASNYERLGFIATRTTRFAIAAENAGTGAARSLEISFYTSASDPTSTDITSGCFSVWKNSGTGTIKLWANDGGTMKSVALA